MNESNAELAEVLAEALDGYQLPVGRALAMWKARAERAEAALSWYADPANYYHGLVGHANPVEWVADEGERARQALALSDSHRTETG